MSRLRPYRVHIILGLLELLILGGALLWVRWPRPEPITIQVPTATPIPTRIPLVVHIAGAVVQPGVYRLAPDSRVVDAVTAAGGLTADVAIEWVNLAAPLQDGQQVFIPYLQEEGEQPATAFPVVRGAPTLVIAASSAQINLNTAAQSELETLSGIGPALAQRIIDYRETHGRFSTADEIMEVSGIGEATYEGLADCVCVE